MEDISSNHLGHSDLPKVSYRDIRANVPEYRVFYRNLHKFRIYQMNNGVDLRTLTDDQWGLRQLDKCHHISTTSTSKEGPQSFRVRICKTCCQEDSHIELGTYVDQESAILVNDTFEILNDRIDRLIVLRVEDKIDLQQLTAKKYDRSKGRDYACIMDLISERVNAIEGKKYRRPSQGDLTAVSSSSNLGVSSLPYSGIKRSPNNSSNSLSRLGGATSVTNSGGNRWSGVGRDRSGSVSSLLLEERMHIYNSSSTTSQSGGSSGSGGEDDASSTGGDGGSGFAAGAQSPLIEGEDIPMNSVLALRELSSVCYERLMSPNTKAAIINEGGELARYFSDPPLASGAVVSGLSLFGNDQPPVPRLSQHSSSNSLYAGDTTTEFTSAGGSSAASPGLTLHDNEVSSGERAPASSSVVRSPMDNAVRTSILCETPVANAINRLVYVASESGSAPRSALSSNGSALKRPRSVQYLHDTEQGQQDQDRREAADAQEQDISRLTFHPDTVEPEATNDAATSASAYQLEFTPRKRAATFSVNEPYPFADSQATSAIATLTWLATMEESEVDVARSLYELRGGGSSSSNANPNHSAADIAGAGNSLALLLNSLDYQHMSEICGEYDEEEGDNEDDMDEDDGSSNDDGEHSYYHAGAAAGFLSVDQYANLQSIQSQELYVKEGAGRSRRIQEKQQQQVGVSQRFRTPAHPNKHTGTVVKSAGVPLKCLTNTVPSLVGNHPTTGRARSSSMSMLERPAGGEKGFRAATVLQLQTTSAVAAVVNGDLGSPSDDAASTNGITAWSILNNSGISGYRSKMDPLSLALKKFHDKGGANGTNNTGFVGIYSPEDRRARIQRFLDKRKRRIWTKKVKYDVRKNFADSRVRVKGRFVKKHEEETYIAETISTEPVGTPGHHGAGNNLYIPPKQLQRMQQIRHGRSRGASVADGSDEDDDDRDEMDEDDEPEVRPAARRLSDVSASGSKSAGARKNAPAAPSTPAPPSGGESSGLKLNLKDLKRAVAAGQSASKNSARGGAGPFMSPGSEMTVKLEQSHLSSGSKY